jgi:hypothetical protein
VYLTSGRVAHFFADTRQEKVMAQRGPLVTAVVVVGGLVGLMTANAAGGFVTAGGPAPTPSPAGATQTEQPTTEPPAETTTAPPLETTTAPPAEQPTAEQPPPAQFPGEVVYAGNAADVPLAIAVAVKGGDASAYLCDGANVESWLKGTAADGAVELVSADGSTTLDATLSGETLAGTVTVAGVPHEFTIGVAGPPAGLYRGENGETTVGWIILPDGTQVGIARTSTSEVPAPPLNPARGGATVGGAFVPAEKVTGDTTFG